VALFQQAQMITATAAGEKSAAAKQHNIQRLPPLQMKKQQQPCQQRQHQMQPQKQQGGKTWVTSKKEVATATMGNGVAVFKLIPTCSAH
jgi:hypothetical protein